MNKSWKYLAVLVLGAFTACDAVEDLVPEIDIALNQEISETLTIPLGDTTFTVDVSQDLEPISDLQEYSENIKGISVDSVTYQFTNLSGGDGGNGSDATFKGTVNVTTAFGGGGGPILGNSTIAANDGGTVRLDLLLNQGEVTVEGADFDGIVNMFNALATSVVTVEINVIGEAVNSAPAPYTVDLVYTIYGKATAKP